MTIPSPIRSSSRDRCVDMWMQYGIIEGKEWGKFRNNDFWLSASALLSFFSTAEKRSHSKGMLKSTGGRVVSEKRGNEFRSKAVSKRRWKHLRRGKIRIAKLSPRAFSRFGKSQGEFFGFRTVCKTENALDLYGTEANII